MATVPARLTSAPGAPWVARRLPRALHPGAWWLWAFGLAVAASRTTNPVLLLAIVAVAAWVVGARRSDAPWSRAFRYYLLAGAVVVALRVVFRIVFGGGLAGGDRTVLLHLPRIPLPGGGGIALLGDVTASSLLAGMYDGLRLATMLICLGAANALANPRRLLRSMPPALHEVSTAVVVAMSVFPQLAESLVRVQRARRLRPAAERRGARRLRTLVIPVLEDALDRSVLLAASMDSRGYGRSGTRSRASSRLVGALMIVGLAGICVGVYALLDTTTPRLLSTPMLVAGVAAGVLGLVLSGSGVRRTAYRPDRWRLAEVLTVGSGAACAVLMLWAEQAQYAVLHPLLDPVAWPGLSLLPLAAVLAAIAPAAVAPQPESVAEPA